MGLSENRVPPNAMVIIFPNGHNWGVKSSDFTAWPGSSTKCIEWLWPFLSVVCLKMRRYSTTSSCCKYLSFQTRTTGWAPGTFSARNHKMNTNKHQWAENISDLWRSQTFQTLHTFNSKNFPSQSAQTVRINVFCTCLCKCLDENLSSCEIPHFQLPWPTWSGSLVSTHHVCCKILCFFNVTSTLSAPQFGFHLRPCFVFFTFCTYRINPIYIYIYTGYMSLLWQKKTMHNDLYISFSHRQDLKWFPQYEIGIISSPLGHMI